MFVLVCVFLFFIFSFEGSHFFQVGLIRRIRYGCAPVGLHSLHYYFAFWYPCTDSCCRGIIYRKVTWRQGWKRILLAFFIILCCTRRSTFASKAYVTPSVLLATPDTLLVLIYTSPTLFRTIYSS